MPKVKISEFDVNPDNNTDINNINIAEGCAPSGINNAIRQLMSDLKEFQTGAGGDSITAVGVYSDTVGEKTSGAGVTVDGVLLKDNAVTASGGFSGALNGAIGGTTPAAGAFTTLSASGAFSANGGATLGDASGDALTINSSAVSIPNGLNFDSNTFVIDATNNRVGVGVASPQERFDVNGNIQVGYTASGQYVDVYNGDTTNYQRLRLSMSGNNAFITTRRSSGTVPQMLFGIDNTEAMRIDTSGNVGIGTSSPAARLQVNAATTTTPSLTYGTTSGQIFRNENSELAIGLSSTAPYPLYLQGRQSTNVAREIVFNPVGGNVGVGVTTTGGLLDVGGVFKIQNNGDVYGASGNTGALLFCGGSAYDAGGSIKLYGSSNGNMITFQTGAFAERMRIDSSGNVGIGTSSPNKRLTVNSATNDVEVLRINAPGGGGGTQAKADIGFGYYDGVTEASAAIGFEELTTASTGGVLLFKTRPDGSSDSTRPTERMRIDSSGNLLVGTTTLYGKVTSEAAGANATESPFSANVTSASGVGSCNVFRSLRGGTQVGSITNTSTATAYNTSSDYRLKENIAPMTGALNVVQQLKPVTYTWKADGSDGQGFIAHELAEVVPDCVTGEKDAVDAEGNPQYQGIDTSFLVATLTASIQELKAIVDAQAARIAVLESK